MNTNLKTVHGADIGVRSTSAERQCLSPENVPESFKTIEADEVNGQASAGSAGTVNFEQKELCDLIRRAKGIRTVSQYAEQAGVSRSTVSDLVNCRVTARPSKRTLMKLFHKTAEPAAGSLEEALRLAHYAPYDRLDSCKDNRTIVIKPLSMLLELLTETSQIGLQFRADMSVNGKVTVVDYSTRRRFVGLPAFKGESRNAAETELILKAMLLDEVFSTDTEKAETTYIIMADDGEVYRRFSQLPFIQCKAMYVLVTNNEHLRFTEGVRIKQKGETESWVCGDPL